MMGGIRLAGVVVGILILIFAAIVSGIDTKSIKTTLNNFDVLAEIDYVNGTSSLTGEYGTEVASVEVEDLDNDGTKEYITLSKDVTLGPFWVAAGGVNLRVWHQNGNNFTVVDEKTWDFNVSLGGFWGADVDVYQMDDTPNLELITVSKNNNPNKTGRDGYLRVWAWENSKLNLLSQVNWSDPYGGDVCVRGLAEGDIDGDGSIELCAVGNLTGHSSGSAAFLVIAEYSSGALHIEKFQIWNGDGNGGATATSVDVDDVNGDGEEEIVTGGARVKLYPDNSYTQAGEIRVWKYDGTSLSLITSVAWDSTIGNETGDTANRLITDVKINNGEIFVTSNAEAGYKWGEITVWKLVNGNLQMIASLNFLYNLNNIGMQSDMTIPVDLKFGDVDGNGEDEIVVVGGTGNSNVVEYFIAIFDYDSTITERTHEIWYDLIQQTSTGLSGIHLAESVAIDKNVSGKDRIVVVGVYVEAQHDSFPRSCKHGRIWLLEYNTSPTLEMHPLLIAIASLFLIFPKFKIR